MVASPKKRKKRKEPSGAQHARFVETAKVLGASEDPKDFDKAFKRVTSSKK